MGFAALFDSLVPGRRDPNNHRASRPTERPFAPDQLAIERLETRMMLAANLNDGLLEVYGSAGDDLMRLEAGPQQGDVALYGVADVQDGTIFSSVSSVVVRARAGNDQVKVESLSLMPNANHPQPCLDVGGGFGDDLIEVHSLVGSGSDVRDFVVDGGAGNDTIRLLLGDGTAGNTVPELNLDSEIFGRGGSDTIEVKYTGPLQIDFSLIVDGGAHSDTLDVTIVPNSGQGQQPLPLPKFAVDVLSRGGNDDVKFDAMFLPAPCLIVADFGIETGAGADVIDIVVDSSAQSSLIGMEILSGAGNDLVNSNVQLNGGDAGLAIDVGLGAGNDVLEFDLTPGADAFIVDLNIDAGDGNDVVNVVDPQPRKPPRNCPTPCPDILNVGINLGAGDDVGSFALESSAENLALTLEMIGGTGNDDVATNVLFPVGAGEIEADIGFDTGLGDDILDFGLDSSAESLLLGMDVLTGSGNDEGNFDIGWRFGEVGFAMDVELGDGADVFDFNLAKNAAEAFIVDLSIDAGQGNDVVMVTDPLPRKPPRNCPTPCPDELNVAMDLGAGDDIGKFTLDSSAENLQLTLDIVAGVGNDVVTTDILYPSNPGTIVSDIGIDTGAGDDVVNFHQESAVEQLDQTLRIETGTGADMVNVDLSTPNIPAFIPAFHNSDIGIELGSGHDTANVVASFAVDSELVLTILGQAGNDVITAVAELPVPCFFEADILIDGGNGNEVIDLFVASSAEHTNVAMEIFGRADDDDIKVVVNQPLQPNLPIPCLFEADVLVDGGIGNDTLDVFLISSAEETDVALTMLGRAGTDVLTARMEHPIPCLYKADVLMDGGAGHDTMALAMDFGGQSPNAPAAEVDLMFSLLGRGGNDKLDANLNLSGANGSVIGDLQGGIGDDDLTLLASGIAQLQAQLLVDGGAGFDNCNVTPGVVVQNCEN